MSRLIWVPQFPTKMRYQEWHYGEFLEVFLKEFDEVIVLGDKSLIELKVRTVQDKEMFSPIDRAIQFELNQVEEYLALELKDDDVLFHSDLSFPGIFHHVLYHKRPSRCYCYCHGTSLNNMDYFAGEHGMSKWNVERGVGQIYDAILIASDYHWRKLWSAGLHNLRVIGLPAPKYLETFNQDIKTMKIVSACRPTPQKVNIKLETQIEKDFDTEIVRADFDTWEGYYKFLAHSKILLLTTSEETFGYTILDAVMNGCIPVAPRDFSYPELLHDAYLYNDEEHLYFILHSILERDILPVPTLINQTDIDNFYDSLISILKNGERNGTESI